MHIRKVTLLIGMVLLALSVTVMVYAQSGGDYDLSWNTIDSGGSMGSTGGDFALSGSIGQAEAGIVAGGEFALSGGFWFEATNGYRIMLPLMLK
jgi:hypothetical protein